MKKTLFTIIGVTGILLYIMLSCRNSFAQIIPDTIFDKPPRAFGNTIQDVPPDILSVKISPESPKAGESVLVSAKIWVNPEISKFKVKEAYVYYREIGGKTDLKRVGMDKSPDDPELWTALLPGFPEGAVIEYYIRAIDEIGNEVVQLPTNADPGPGQFINILLDGEDDDVPATMDVLSVYAGYDGKDLIACPSTRRRFQQFSRLGADAIAVGFVADDVREHPTRSVTENTSGFVGYIPALAIEGILRVEDLERGMGKHKGEASAKIMGRQVCLRAPVASLTTTPDRGLKIFGATIGINALSKEVTLGDATPYAIVYFKGGGYTVGAKLP